MVIGDIFNSSGLIRQVVSHRGGLINLEHIEQSKRCLDMKII